MVPSIFVSLFFKQAARLNLQYLKKICNHSNIMKCVKKSKTRNIIVHRISCKSVQTAINVKSLMKQPLHQLSTVFQRMYFIAYYLFFTFCPRRVKNSNKLSYIFIVYIVESISHQLRLTLSQVCTKTKKSLLIFVHVNKTNF